MHQLVHLNGTPYFNKYFRLPAHYELRKSLVNALLQRLDERTEAWEARYHDRKKSAADGGIAIESMIYDFCQLTTSLLLFHSEEDVQELSKLPMIKHLQYFLGMWNDRYAGVSSEVIAENAMSSREKQKTPTPASVAEDRRQWPAYQLSMILMNGRDNAELAAITAARLSKGGMSRCALQGCNRTAAIDGGALLQCSQCGTVRYVSIVEVSYKVSS